MAGDHVPNMPEPEKLRLEAGQLVKDVWDAAIGGAPEEEKVRLRGASYDLAASLFIAGRIAERPTLEVMERRIRQCIEAVTTPGPRPGCC